MADTTSTSRILLYTKTSAGLLTDASLLKNKEICFTNLEKSIYVKDYGTNALYRFSPIDDTTYSLYRTWSSDYIKSYVDSNINIINDSTTLSSTKVWSNNYTKLYIDNIISNLTILEIDDSTNTSTSVWSSYKTKTYIDNLSISINDTTNLETSVWSSYKTKTYIDNLSLSIIDTTSVDSTSLWSREYTKSYIDTSILNIDIPSVTISDNTNVDSTSFWSREYTKLYVDTNIIEPTRAILLTASGLIPDPTDPCGIPITNSPSGSDGIAINYSEFTQNEKGVWNILVPSDYTGYINNIYICYSGPIGTVQWEIKSNILSTGNLETEGTWSSPITLSGTSAVANGIITINGSSGYSTVLGQSSDINKLSVIRIKLLSNVTCKLYQVKFIY